MGLLVLECELLSMLFASLVTDIALFTTEYVNFPYECPIYVLFRLLTVHCPLGNHTCCRLQCSIKGHVEIILRLLVHALILTISDGVTLVSYK